MLGSSRILEDEKSVSGHFFFKLIFVPGDVLEPCLSEVVHNHNWHFLKLIKVEYEIDPDRGEFENESGEQSQGKRHEPHADCVSDESEL